MTTLYCIVSFFLHPSIPHTDKVALKILDRMKLDAQAQRLLSREISSMEFMQHPNLIRLYEVVETPSRLYLVLEYAGGGDLHNRICNEGKLSDNTSKITFAQILCAIKYMVGNVLVLFFTMSSDQFEIKAFKTQLRLQKGL